MSDTEDEIKTGNYWPSVADLFLTLFVIAIAIVAVVFYSLLPTNNVGKDRALVNAVGNDLRHIRAPINRLRTSLELEQIKANARPTEVMTALTETCDRATSQIENLHTQITDLQSRITRLMGSKDTQAEMERLLKENDNAKRELAMIQLQMQKLIRTFGADPDAIKNIIKENEDLRRQLHDKPPNIQISEQKKDYRFESGSSDMGAPFIEGLRKNEFDRLAREIVEREAEGRVKVDTLEIIGHTDGVPLARNGNLDVNLPDVLAGNGSKISSLTAGSNNDLGLLRALAVKEQWMRFVNTHDEKLILQRVSVRCYSAGQTILPDTKITPSADAYRKSNDNARRIEMRLTRLLN